jgi:hypothetical protein
MSGIFNQYSYVVISLMVLIVSAALLRRYAANGRIIAATLGVMILLSLAGNFLLRPGSSDIDSLDAAKAALHNGRPTLLEFFSNFCASCLALRPAVDVMVSDIEDEYNILRIDIHTDLGRQLRESIEFSYTPEFALFDSSGTEVWRGHTLPPREHVYALAPNLPQPTMPQT